MKLEVGKYYITASGQKVGPVVQNREFGRYTAGNIYTYVGGNRSDSPQIYNADGSVYNMQYGEEMDHLVSEAPKWIIGTPTGEDVLDRFDFAYDANGNQIAYKVKTLEPIMPEIIRVCIKRDIFSFVGYLFEKSPSNATMKTFTKNGVPVGTWTIEFDAK